MNVLTETLLYKYCFVLTKERKKVKVMYIFGELMIK